MFNDHLTPPPTSVYRPPGWLYLFDAYQEVGRHLFGDEWTRAEYKAHPTYIVHMFKERSLRAVEKAEHEITVLEDPTSNSCKQYLDMVRSTSQRRHSGTVLALPQETATGNVTKLRVLLLETLHRKVARERERLEGLPKADSQAFRRHDRAL